MKLIGKIIINGLLETQTGLHIGGSKTSLNIGGIDNNVIKTARGVPYIPGSSIKGKIRSLLASTEGSLFFSKTDKRVESNRMKSKIKKEKETESNSAKLKLYESYQTAVETAVTDEDTDYLIELFGASGDSPAEERGGINYTRLIVRDAFLANPNDSIFNNGFTDSKWENIIDRTTGTAGNPRQQERVPAGAQFNLEMVYNLYAEDASGEDKRCNEHLKKILLGIKLLEDDGLGGNISRGYGQIKFKNPTYVLKLIDTSKKTYLPSDEIGEEQKFRLPEFFRKEIKSHSSSISSEEE